MARVCGHARRKCRQEASDRDQPEGELRRDNNLISLCSCSSNAQRIYRTLRKVAVPLPFIGCHMHICQQIMTIAGKTGTLNAYVHSLVVISDCSLYCIIIIKKLNNLFLPQHGFEFSFARSRRFA